MREMSCDYCQRKADLVGGDSIYPHRPDLASKRFYLCAPCDAYVGCHPGTEQPLGRLAKADLRRAKMRAHEAFDRLWKEQQMGRHEAYAWLSKQLSIPIEKTHIGMFDLPTCERVVGACSQMPCQGPR